MTTTPTQRRRAQEIAQAVTDELNAHQWPLSFEAQRHWWIQAELDESPRPTVTVCPVEVIHDIESTGLKYAAKAYGILIAVQQKLKTTDAKAQIDSLVSLAETIWTHFEGSIGADSPLMSGADWQETEHDELQILDRADLYERGLVTIAATLRYLDQT